MTNATRQTLKDRIDKVSSNSGPMLLPGHLNKAKFDSEGSISAYTTKVLEYRDQVVHAQQALINKDIIPHLTMNSPPS